MNAADADPRPCPLCCPLTGHTTTAVPRWLGDSALSPAHWRFVWHVIGGSPLEFPGGPRERLDGARLYQHVYGDTALARAIREAQGLPVLHGRRWDPMWDRLLDQLHRAAAS